MVDEIDYQLDGVPTDLALMVRSSESIQDLLAEVQATGIRLVALPGGWSDPRSGAECDAAFEIQVLGRPGQEDDTSIGRGGRCFVKEGQEWRIAHIAAF